MINADNEYEDDYSSCETTYATLRIFSDDIEPSSITDIMGIKPSEILNAGEKNSKNSDGVHKINSWFLSSEHRINSKDSRRHIDWIIDQIKGKDEKLKELQNRNVLMDIFCFWSATGLSGGPIISTFQMRELSRLNIELMFDFYN